MAIPAQTPHPEVRPYRMVRQLPVPSTPRKPRTGRRPRALVAVLTLTSRWRHMAG